MGTGTSINVNNEFNLPQIEHFKIPSLTTLADGTEKLLQWGGANADLVQASGGTYNLVEKIDTIISTIQGQLPAKIIFTTTSTNPPNVSWTVLAGVNSVPGTPAIDTSTSGVYQGQGGGSSWQIGNITVPVAEGMELTISLGVVSPPGNTVAYGTSVEINSIPVITCNGASGNTSRMDGGNGATLNTNVFCSYSCGGGGGMNSDGGDASGTGSSGSTSLFSAPPALLGGVFLSSNTSGRLGCGGCGGFGNGSGDLIAPGSGGGSYVKLRLY